MAAQFQTTGGKEQTDAKLDNSGKGGASFLSGVSRRDVTPLSGLMVQFLTLFYNHLQTP